MDCHNEFDNGSGKYSQAIKKAVRDYLQGQYDDWSEENLIYDKWRDFEI